MLRKILTIAVILTLVIVFGCKKTEKPSAAPSTTTVFQKQAEKEVTEKNMDQQLEKIEKEIKTDVNAQ